MFEEHENLKKAALQYLREQGDYEDFLEWADKILGLSAADMGIDDDL